MNFKLNIQLFGNAVIPYNEGRNGKRSIDGLWEQEFNVAKALTAAIGCEFGSVLNIQDAGQKEQGKIYLDKNNGKLYKCLNTTTSVSNTTKNFALFNVQQNSDRLDNLIRINSTSIQGHLKSSFDIGNIGFRTFHGSYGAITDGEVYINIGSDFEKLLSICITPANNGNPKSGEHAVYRASKSTTNTICVFLQNGGPSATGYQMTIIGLLKNA